jgi:hypothetical protein
MTTARGSWWRDHAQAVDALDALKIGVKKVAIF